MLRFAARLFNRSLGLFGARLSRLETLNGRETLIGALTSENRTLTEHCAALSHAFEHLRSKHSESPAGSLAKPLPRSLTKRCLFVVGNARSGTTLLYMCLNQSPDVFLLNESSFYLHLQKPDFVHWYNDFQKGLGNQRGKDTWIPCAPNGDSSGVATLKNLAHHHRWVGEKIAFGPHPDVTGRSNQEVFFDFQSRYFYDSTYLLLLRKPNEVVFSSSKMFTAKKTEELIQSWLKTFIVEVDIYCSLPNAEWFFHQDLENSVVNDIAERLGVSSNLPEGTVCPGEQASSLDEDEIPPLMAEFSDIIQRANSLYADFRSAINQPHIRSTYIFRGFTERATEILKEIRSGSYSRRQWLSEVA